MVADIRTEFGRQASRMALAPAFHDEQVLRKLSSALVAGPADHVLEVACGPGIVAEALAPLVSELICIDATTEMIDLAKSRIEMSGHKNVFFQEALAEELPFADHQFDAIVSRLSFHHFRDTQAVLKEFRRVLRPQGRLILADIISSSSQIDADLHNAIEQLRDPTHVHMYSMEEFEAALQAGGFEPEFTELWEQPRNFSEWAQIVSDSGRTKPLKKLLRALSRSGLHLGLTLHEENGEIRFKHQWLLVVATLRP